ncbi:MAG: Vitamin B12 import ATP-binding protein BtuD [Chlamydiales bacterium]|nr:Vitamin B12 import ATP-binding protein BtuD [Chlamydiales bacterium]MCH9619087.1 Vitamin B12 import ATP-binding protein BtuD [Chlamydiales bacterium]MCH9622349.1 Vitamin B12 import ATP-binding protein BtuD [Chlamydiales bacterium]
MLLLTAESISKSYGSRELFSHLNFSLFAKDRVGLIGKNGSGKSTFMKILAGLEECDHGSLSFKKGLKVGYLPQTCDFPDENPYELMLNYGDELSVKKWMSKLGFTGDELSAAHLSGGWKKRLRLVQEMLQDPDLLLLDEPTNHLDLEGVVFLERFLKHEVPSYILVSHDRYFLSHATNRILEIDPLYPEGLFSVNLSYQDFLVKKEAFLQGQLQKERSYSSKARRELDWLKASPKARTTKSKSRIDRANELFQDLADIKKRNLEKRAEINFISNERETKRLLVAKNIGKSMGEKNLFSSLDFTLSPGSRLALMGPNGSGKTTLLRILADELKADLGTLKRADNLKAIYFDQHRNQLPDHLSLKEALSPNGDFVNFHGNRIHINGFCKRFLFTPDMLEMPIEKLSGGERARISIAHLMLQPADLLLLDEPTNDLDIPTLETLERSLLEFPGAVVLITHDRCMLDRTCNMFLSLNNGAIYADYAKWSEAQVKPVKSKKTAPPIKKKASLSYKEKREYEAIEGKILKLEEEGKRLTHQIEETNLSSEKLTELCQAIALVDTQIEQLFLRFEELDQKR